MTITVGRNLFPSTPILKKYSAAEASFGTWGRKQGKKIIEILKCDNDK